MLAESKGVADTAALAILPPSDYKGCTAITAMQRVSIPGEKRLDSLFFLTPDIRPEKNQRTSVGGTALLFRLSSPPRLFKRQEDITIWGDDHDENHLSIVAKAASKFWAAYLPFDSEEFVFEAVNSKWHDVENADALLIEIMTELSLSATGAADAENIYRDMKTDIVDFVTETWEPSSISKTLKALVRAEFSGYSIG